jgi:hypothetical protein
VHVMARMSTPQALWTWPPNTSCRMSKMTFSVCGYAPFCWERSHVPMLFPEWPEWPHFAVAKDTTGLLWCSPSRSVQ